MAGRPQVNSRKGPTYQLAEFMNDNWDKLVGRTNDEVATELGYRAPNIISMFRTGKTRVPLERLPDIARLMKLDIAVLLPLWFEQYWGERDDAKVMLKLFTNRVASAHEADLLEVIRKATKSRDPLWNPQHKLAVQAVLTDPDVLKAALDAANAKGMTIASS